MNSAHSRVELSWDVERSAVLSGVQRERIVARLGRRLTDGVLTVTASENREQRRNRGDCRLFADPVGIRA